MKATFLIPCKRLKLNHRLVRPFKIINSIADITCCLLEYGRLVSVPGWIQLRPFLISNY